MLETLKQRIQKLIALYETEKAERVKLRMELEKTQRQNEAYREQITELEREIDNLKLKGAFMAGGTDNAQARKRIDRLVKEIDRCITLMEG
jgi:predicted  nucleic acid-binding Zn-ribbon protein